MCCHLFQCLALVPLQTLKESPGPCTAVAEMQSCNPYPGVGLGVFQKGLNSQLRLNPPLPPLCYMNVIARSFTLYTSDITEENIFMTDALK